MKDKHIELINKMIDGELTNREKSKVDKLIAEDSEAKKYYNDLKKLDSSLKTEDKSCKEVDFTNEIMRRVNVNQYTTNSKNLSQTKQMALNYNLKYGISFAFGVAATILIFVVFIPLAQDNSVSNQDNLIGMISSVNPKNLSVDTSHIIEKNDVVANIDFIPSGDMTIAKISTNSDKPIRLELENINNNYKFDGFTVNGDWNQNKVEMLNNKIIINTQNDNKFTVFLKKLSNNNIIQFKLFKENSLEYQNNLSTK